MASMSNGAALLDAPSFTPDLDHLNEALGRQEHAARQTATIGGVSGTPEQRYYEGKADGIEQAKKSLGYARDPEWLKRHALPAAPRLAVLEAQQETKDP